MTEEDKKLEISKTVGLNEEALKELTEEVEKIKKDKENMYSLAKALLVDVGTEKEKKLFLKGYVFGREVESNEYKTKLKQVLDTLERINDGN